MKNRISAFLIITLSLLCISCDFSIADLLNEKLELTPPIYLSYHTEYGKVPARKTVQKGDVITEKMLPEVAYTSRNNGDYYYYDEEEQTFDGWYYDEQYLNKVEVGDVIEQSTIIYAKWKNTNINIYFYLKNGYFDKYYDSNSYYDYNSYYKIYTNRYKIGTVLSSINLPVPYYNSGDYSFLGWYLDPDYNTPAEGYVIESEITLYAKERYEGYCKIGYSTSRYSESQETKSLKAGEKLDSYYLPELTPYSEYENYEFMGWYYDYEYTRQAQEGDEVNTDIYLYAKWVEKYVYINYFSNYSIAEFPERKKVENGSSLVLDYMPELTPSSDYEDYRFVGWYYDYEYINEAHVGDVLDRSITLYAKFEPIHVRLYYDTRGYADSIENKVVDNGSILTADLLPELVPDSSYDNLVFAGWYYDIYYERPAYAGDILSIDNSYLFAKYDVTFDGTFLECWVFDETVSDDYKKWESLTSVYNPTFYFMPKELHDGHNYVDGYNYVGEETLSYDSYYYGGVEYNNVNIIKRYYVKREISSNNLAHLLSLSRTYGGYEVELAITDSNPDVEEIASILRNNNAMSWNISLDLHNSDLICVPDNCFMDVPHLVGVYLPYSVQTIGNNAFKGCLDFYKIIMYDCVTLIEESAFENTPLWIVYYSGSYSDKAYMTINDTTILNAEWNYNWYPYWYYIQ